MANVLIIDDDRGMCALLAGMVLDMGHKAVYAHSAADGLDEALSRLYDVVFLDVRLPDGSGLDILPDIRKTPSSPEVIIMTGFGDPDGAEIAIKNGAWDYLRKPLSPKKLMLPLNRVLQYRDNITREKKKAVVLKRERIVGSSLPIAACLELLSQACQSDANVIITGETGTGKELFAWAIHENSLRSGGNFVVVDCAALPESLVDGILLGHERGAFTGADKSREGLVKQADGGTLFLDEVGELPLAVQKSFLRTLQERRFRPLGGKQEIKSDFRLVAATNRDLDQMARQGKFRKDLLFRLRSFTMEIPPLRDRKKDIRELAMHHMVRLCGRHGTNTKGFSPEFFQALESYDWPGNVRELFHALDRAFSSAKQDPVLFPTHLPTRIRVWLAQSSFEKRPSNESLKMENVPKPFPALKEFRKTMIAEVEIKYLKDLMSLTRGDIGESCRISGVSRARLYGLLKKYGISRFE